MLTLSLILFVSGVLTVLLPCILPILPIVLGVSVTGRSKWQPLVTVAGMVVSFVGFTFLLQVVLAQFYEFADILRIATYYVLLLFGLGFFLHGRLWQMLGAALGALFFWDKGWIAVIIALILGVLAMEIGGRVAARIQQAGADLQQEARMHFGAQSLLTAFILGLTIGLVWVPCAGPALGFALTLVRDEPGPRALLYLTMYGLGAGVPLLLIGYGGQYAVQSARSIGQYSGRIKQVAGALLILSALAFRFGWFQDLQTWFVENTSFGTFGTNLEEALFGEQMPGRTDSAPEAPSGKIDETILPTLPVLGKAPANFLGSGPWHNSKALTMEDLKGKVVLVDFWTYSCINCIRTLPYIQGYWSKYKDRSFVLLGVHSPEFIFEKSEDNVAAAIERHRLTYPVMQDNDFVTWRAFDNHYWPAKYLIDPRGNIRYVHFGEGEYEETDRAISSLLAEMGLKTDAQPLGTSAEADRRPLTPEIYLSTRSWKDFENSVDPDEAAEGFAYQWPVSGKTLPLHHFALSGKWQLVDDERQVLRDPAGRLYLHALGREVNLVLGLEPGAKPVNVEITVDGKREGIITVNGDDLYPLYNGEYGEHEIILHFQGPGIAAYAFTFGS